MKISPDFFGMLEDESSDGRTGHIRHSEGQHYHPSLWDLDYVTRFDTLEEAIDFYLENRPGVDIRDKEFTPDEVREQARQRFPSYFKDKK